MKKVLILCISTVIIGFGFSCKKTIDKLTEFDIDYTNNQTIPAVTYTLTVPADTISAPASFDSPVIATDQANKFGAQKTSQKLITEIKLTKFNISVATGNFDAMRSIAIYLKSADLGDVLIAKKANIPKGTSSIVTDVQDVNIKEYIFKDNMQFKLVIRMGIAANPEQQLKMDETFHVKASVLN